MVQAGCAGNPPPSTAPAAVPQPASVPGRSDPAPARSTSAKPAPFESEALESGATSSDPTDSSSAPSRALVSAPNCAIRPALTAMLMTVPPTAVPVDEGLEACEFDANRRLRGDDIKQANGSGAHARFRVSYAGPSGSGRYWDVAVSTGPQARGFCFQTSTVGWRMVGGDPVLAKRMLKLIRWVQDVDGDGHDELVVRDSFPLSTDASLASYGITAFAYDLLGDQFVLDAASTGSLQREIAAAYEQAVGRERRDSSSQGRRRRAAQLLRQCAAK